MSICFARNTSQGHDTNVCDIFLGDVITLLSHSEKAKFELAKCELEFLSAIHFEIFN